MRHYLLLAIVAVVCVTALARPVYGLCGYIWYALLRPDVLAFAPPTNRYSFILAVCVLVGSLPHLPARMGVLFRHPLSLGLLLFQVPIVLSAVMAVNPALSYPRLQLYLKIILMACLIPLLVRTQRDLRLVILVMTASLGVLGAKFGLFGLLHGGVRYAQGYGGFFSDNNTLALALAMAVPLCWCTAPLVDHRYVRWGFRATALVTIAGVVMTYSRGALVAVFCGVAVLVLQSRHRIALIGGASLIGVFLASLLGPAYIERVSTLQDISSEASANSRLVLARAGLEMARDYPILGVGFGSLNERALVDQYLPAGSVSGNMDKVIHNTYVQVMTDSGIPAGILFTMLLGGAIVSMSRECWTLRSDPRAAAIPQAIQSSLIVYAVGSLALSRVDFDLFYMLLACAVAWKEIRQAEPAAELASDEAPGRQSAGDAGRGAPAAGIRERLRGAAPLSFQRLVLQGARSRLFPQARGRG